jgi:hypothetical protein
MKAGAHWNDPNSLLRRVMHKADAVVILAVLLGIAWLVSTHWKNRVGRPGQA